MRKTTVEVNGFIQCDCGLTGGCYKCNDIIPENTYPLKKTSFREVRYERITPSDEKRVYGNIFATKSF